MHYKSYLVWLTHFWTYQSLNRSSDRYTHDLFSITRARPSAGKMRSNETLVARHHLHTDTYSLGSDTYGRERFATLDDLLSHALNV